ncbi:hypothetical protein [Vibrio navarrensis]|uniref:hypothetical protein n=1 Tax=Vibrio navarrensis TaxID=29495 RepID=UPI00186A2692|nr:hypothetical protein [Vibrio navarrensis]
MSRFELLTVSYRDGLTFFRQIKNHYFGRYVSIIFAVMRFIDKLNDGVTLIQL